MKIIASQRFLLIVLAAMLWVMAGVGCNTVHGAGQDVQQTGEAIQRHTP